MKTRVNGKELSDYKDFEVLETGLAVPRAEPLYIPAVSNGYPPGDIILDDNLVLYLPLYLLKGSKFKSLEGYNRSATVTGALWRPNGRYFDGVDDDISLGDVSSLDFAGDSSFTLAAWVNITNQYDAVLSKYDYNNDKGWMLYIYGWKIRLTLNKNEAYFQSTAILTSGTWAFIAGVKSSTDNLVGYIDGNVVSAYDHQDAGVDVNSPTGLDCLVGDRQDSPDGTYAAEGTLGEVLVYSRALSAAEISHLYNTTVWRYT